MSGPLITIVTPPTPMVADRHFSESPLVTIIVDDGDHKFFVHKNLLVSNSKYFAAALSNPLASESHSNQILLRHDDGHEANAFGSVVDWLYGGNASLAKVAPMKNTGLPANRQAQVALTKVYIQAHKLMIPKLQNQIVNEIMGFSVITLPSLKALSMVHDAIPIDTPLESYYLDCLAYWLRDVPEFLEYNVNGWHIEANQYLAENSDLAYLVLKKICKASSLGPAVNPYDYPMWCPYHEHDKDLPVDGECLSHVGQGSQVTQQTLGNGVGVGLITSGHEYDYDDVVDDDEDYDGDFDGFPH